MTDRSTHIDAAATAADGGRDYCTELARLTDEWLVDLFDDVLDAHRPRKGRVALLALGGYGRGELAPFSDLDVLLVHDVKPRKVEAEVGPLASALWYPLWDSGVKLGHGVRRPDEQLELARTDLDSATALLTARPLAGDDGLAGEVIAAGRLLWEDKGPLLLDELHERVVTRQHDSADVAYHLEPDLKDGHGGLRDVQSLWWAAEGGLNIRAEDLIDLDESYETLMRARVSLHLAVRRAGDILRLEDQDAVARQGGWSDADALMSSVAAAGRRIAWLADENWERAVKREHPADRAIAPGIALKNGDIELTERADPATDSTLVLQAAVAASRSGCRISRSTLDTLRDEAPPWPGSWPVGATDELVALLLEGHSAIPVLEALDQNDLVDRLLPEWGSVRSKPQRNAYHRFTVDRHLWEAAANAAGHIDRVARPDLLVLGALMHDLGKGYPGDHTEVGMQLVREIGPRLGLNSSDVDILVLMVEHHLLLADVAMRRDLTDAATIKTVADAVGSTEVLDLLWALTEADSEATGPSAWGSWKAGLVNELVERVRHVLGGGDVEEVAWSLFPDAEVLSLMAAGDLHLELKDDLITVVNRDAAGTFSQVAGVLSLHGLDVVSARAHSDEIGMAASEFRVVPPQGGVKWDRIEADLRHAIDHRLAIEARLAERALTYRRQRRTQADLPGPPRVTFVDGASSNATVIEITAPNKVGILHRMTKALTELGLDIRHATVQTIGMEVVDTFYVRNAEGRLLDDPFHRGEVERALLFSLA